MGENIYSSYVKNEQPIKRLEQNQIYGSYRYEVVEAWNELAINMKQNKYEKARHIIVYGEANLGKTYFLSKLIGK
jgi:hypothetical protein